MTQTTATLVTCSYAPDFERCERLCRGVHRYVHGDIPHLIIVPRRDKTLFAPLANERTRVVTVESLMPWGTFQLPFQRRWWVCPGCLPIRGWIMQQVTKIAAADIVETDVMVFVDSDVSFIRPFGVEQLLRDGRVRLHRMPGVGGGPKHRRWNHQAGVMLGIEPSDYYGNDYIAQLACWRRETVLAMRERLEQVGKRDWRRLLFNTLHFAEYVLYGVFVEKVCEDWAGHFPDDQDLCHCSWHHTIKTENDLDTFFEGVEPGHVALLVQSNLGIDLSSYVDRLEQLEVRLAAASDASRSVASHA